MLEKRILEIESVHSLLSWFDTSLFIAIYSFILVYDWRLSAKCNSELNDCSTICELGIVLEDIYCLLIWEIELECNFEFGCQPFDFFCPLATVVFLSGYSETFRYSLPGMFYWFQHQFVLIQ